MAAVPLSHEAWCLDSLQHRFYWRDDFEGDILKDEWTLSTVGAGSGYSMVDGVDGGVIRLSTDVNISDVSEINWGAIYSLHVDNYVAFEFRCKLSHDNQVNPYCGFNTSSGSSYLMFYRATGASWYGVSRGQGGLLNTAVIEAFDTDWHIGRFEFFKDQEIVRWYWDNLLHEEMDVSLRRYPDDLYMQTRLNMTAGNAGARNLDVDYVEVKQLRVAPA